MSPAQRCQGLRCLSHHSYLPRSASPLLSQTSTHYVLFNTIFFEYLEAVSLLCEVVKRPSLTGGDLNGSVSRRHLWHSFWQRFLFLWTRAGSAQGLTR